MSIFMAIGLFACSNTQKESVVVENEPKITIDSSLQAGVKNESDGINDFSTQARVEYVLECMKNSGGQSYQTMYPCVCAVDLIATKMSLDEFNEALTYQRLRTVAGERGSVFRDPERSSDLRKRLQQAELLAETSCNVHSRK